MSLKLPAFFKSKYVINSENAKCIKYANGYRCAMKSLLRGSKPEEYSDTIPYHRVLNDYDRGRKDALSDYCEFTR